VSDAPVQTQEKAEETWESGVTISGKQDKVCVAVENFKVYYFILDEMQGLGF